MAGASQRFISPRAVAGGVERAPVSKADEFCYIARTLPRDNIAGLLMIPRYSRPEMAAIWEPENKFDIWLQIEILACEALALRKEIPQSAVDEIKKKARFDVDRIDEIESEVKHDVIAFLTCVSENV